MSGLCFYFRGDGIVQTSTFEEFWREVFSGGGEKEYIGEKKVVFRDFGVSSRRS